MPGINVIDSDGDLQRFPEATTWHLDDRGQLHVKSAVGPVASFAKDCWQGVSTDDEEPRTARTGPREADLAIRADGRSLSVKLNDLELSSLLISGGLSIDFVRPYEGQPDQPQVTMTFAAGALDFDLDADLAASLQTVIETREQMAEVREELERVEEGLNRVAESQRRS